MADDDRYAGRSPATRVVHAGLAPAEPGTPFLGGPVFASAFHLPGDPNATEYGYARRGIPTWAAYERALAELEDAQQATVFPSGMAACSAVMLSTLAPGDVFVASGDGYPIVRTLAEEHLVPRGIEVRYVPTAGDWSSAIGGARLVWLETPTNPTLDLCDVEAIARTAHEAGALVALDNTLATPLSQSPLALGCDFAVASDTKGMTGHTDLLMGHVATRDERLGAQIRDWRTHAGAVPGPFEVWLAHRSLATLDVRLERQCANAQALAEALASRADVADVRYPGLPSHPQHDLARRQMRRFGVVVSFTLESAERAQRFIETCTLVIEATSFGGVHTTAERRARWGHGDDVAEGFIRLSAGIEDKDDLVGDIHAALDSTT
jgi:cystathionine gamma-lyase